MLMLKSRLFVVVFIYAVCRWEGSDRHRERDVHVHRRPRASLAAVFWFAEVALAGPAPLEAMTYVGRTKLNILAKHMGVKAPDKYKSGEELLRVMIKLTQDTLRCYFIPYSCLHMLVYSIFMTGGPDAQDHTRTGIFIFLGRGHGV